jgi:coenzyme F420-dependent glucose-6-phosphate dehydrogenase
VSDRRAIRLGWWLSSEEHDPRALVGHARHAETIGFSTAMISDHLQPWVRHTGNAPFVWTTLGAIAQATDAIEVGTGVTAMVQRMTPINVAHAAATAAVMFEGRFFLGVGTGERLNEQPFGQRWSRTGERREQLREAVGVLRELWAGTTVNHRGEYWTIENLQLATRPAVPPPIYVAAAGERGATLAGEIGDGMIGVTADAHLVDVFRGSGGDGKPHIGQLHVSLAATLDRAIDQAWEWWPVAAVPSTVLSELARPRDFESVSELASRDAIHHVVVCAADATPVIAAIDRFVGAGYDRVYLHQVGPNQQRLADVASTELLPHYRTG